MTNNNFLLFEI